MQESTGGCSSGLKTDQPWGPAGEMAMSHSASYSPWIDVVGGAKYASSDYPTTRKGSRMTIPKILCVTRESRRRDRPTEEPCPERSFWRQRRERLRWQKADCFRCNLAPEISRGAVFASSQVQCNQTSGVGPLRAMPGGNQGDAARQSASDNPEIHEKCSLLPVTRTRPLSSAVAAMMRSASFRE